MMRFQYLGTGAAEGFPAVFCDCEHCQKARDLGGKNIRTRSQALINGDLLLDLPPDTYLHKLAFGLDLSAVKYLLVTHCHMDHFFPQELSVRGSVFSPVMKSPHLDIFCAKQTEELFDRCTDGEIDEKSRGALSFHILKPFTPVKFGGYTVMPLPANHMGKGDEPFIYHIKDDLGTSILYLHDSGWYSPEVWEYFKTIGRQDLISLDGTNGGRNFGREGGHMGAALDIEAAQEFRKMGIADANTRIVMNHFSHNGGLTHEELEEIAQKENLLVSYDGMTLELN